MNIIMRTKIRKMADDVCINEIDMLRTMKMNNPSLELTIVDDSSNIFPYSMELINQLKEELNFSYICPANKLRRSLNNV